MRPHLKNQNRGKYSGSVGESARGASLIDCPSLFPGTQPLWHTCGIPAVLGKLEARDGRVGLKLGDDLAWRREHSVNEGKT